MLRLHSTVGQVRKRCLLQWEHTWAGRWCLPVNEQEAHLCSAAKNMTARKWTEFHAPLVHSASSCSVISLHSHSSWPCFNYLS